MGIDRIEDGLRQLMRFQQVAKFEQGRRIRGGFAIQINADEAADGLAIIERIFGCFI